MKLRKTAKLDEAYKMFIKIEIASDDTISEEELDLVSENIENKYIGLKISVERLIKEKLNLNIDNEKAKRTIIEASNIINKHYK